MSDDEQGRAGDDEVGLPKATIQKLIQEMLPGDFSCTKDTRDLIAECCKEFVLAISSEANEICEKDSKKTISPEHIVAALKALGFNYYVEEVEECLKDHKQTTKERAKRNVNRLEASGLTQEELEKQQEALFAAARLKYDNNQGFAE
ncbi:histone-fold-containing protein [Atractiella rhizophila]|nr:histone-fold-containing protein [Atractiella rhizophila]